MMSNWTHHIPYILPQGRTVWENPLVKPERDEEEEHEEEEEEDENQIEPESGPTLLTPIQNDECIIFLNLAHGNLPAWSARICSHLLPTKFSCISLKSNRWPGASVVAYNDKFANIYIGDGLKDLGNPVQHFIPPKLGEIQKEFIPNENPEILVEQLDPTLEEEQMFEDEQKAKNNDDKEEVDGAGDEDGDAEEDA